MSNPAPTSKNIFRILNINLYHSEVLYSILRRATILFEKRIMAEKKTKVLSPMTAKEVDGFIVDVDESVERWSELKLSDGSTLKLKQVILQVIRLANEYDQNKNPLYLVQSAPIMAIGSVPDNLKKRD